MENIAQKIIDKCGGHDKVAGWLNLDVSRVYRMTYPKKRGGTDGLIPAKYQSVLLLKANKEGINLSPSEFFDSTVLEKIGHSNSGKVSE